MANPKLPEGVVSKRSVAARFGFNVRHIMTLLEAGVLRAVGTGIEVESVGRLTEGGHYIRCLACGARQAAITPKHLKACSGLSVEGYVQRYPTAPLASTMSSARRAKDDEQRRHQSAMLRRRFQTVEGQVTREQIASASKRLMQTPYKAKAAAFLVEYNRSHREEIAESMRVRWQDPAFRERMRAVHHGRHAQLAASASHARGHLTHTFTKPHQALETALLAAGAQGMVRELLVGHYRVDEGFPNVKLAVEVDGCYWHGCVECGLPGVKGTRTTDKRKTTYLLKRGWRVMRIPEHRIKTALAAVVAEILEACHG